MLTQRAAGCGKCNSAGWFAATPAKIAPPGYVMSQGGRHGVAVKWRVLVADERRPATARPFHGLFVRAKLRMRSASSAYSPLKWCPVPICSRVIVPGGICGQIESVSPSP